MLSDYLGYRIIWAVGLFGATSITASYWSSAERTRWRLGEFGEIALAAQLVFLNGGLTHVSAAFSLLFGFLTETLVVVQGLRRVTSRSSG